ncbi:tRNA modification GTPase [Lachnospiraceae bacterium PFB1-21]
MKGGGLVPPFYHYSERKFMEKPIVAISTAVNYAGIGIVRLSGPGAIQVADKVFVSPKNKKLEDQKTHTIHYGFIKDQDEVVDEVLAMLMKAPHSYTKEDTVEFNCHGGIHIVRKVLSLLIEAGARPAEPGEFTKKAFLNGRLDLSQAEAVSDLIYSQNDYALKSSVGQLRGNLREKIETIRKAVIYNTAFIESALDDPEHISLDGYPEKLEMDVDIWLATLKSLLDNAESGKILKEGIKTVIIGRPNAGKSSLLNVLLGEERAIVTDIAGTTRDILEETINLKGIMLQVIDTAGIRNTKDAIEKIGVEKAKQYVDKADLILYVIDASDKLSEEDLDIMKLIGDKKTIVLLNKTDLALNVTEEEVLSTINSNKSDIKVIQISAKENEGITKLEETITAMFYDGKISFNNEIYITNARQQSALLEASQSLSSVKTSLEANMPEDFYTIDLMDAYESLGKITGESIGEDLVNEIFSKFCMGK